MALPNIDIAADSTTDGELLALEAALTQLQSEDPEKVENWSDCDTSRV